MRQRTIFTFVVLFCLSSCSSVDLTHRQIWMPSERRFISQAEALDMMAGSHILLLGESHDNPEHHRLQTLAVSELAKRSQVRTLAFEMIEEDRQKNVDSYLDANPKSAQGLGAALEWEKRGWPDFAMYAPVFQAGLDGGWRIAAANLARADARKVAKPDALDEKEKARLGATVALLPQQMEALRLEMIDNHCGMLPESALPGMIRLQIAWDGKMARSLVEGAEKTNGLSVLIAGAEHVRKDRAVPLHLAKLAPKAKVVSVAFKEQTDPPSPPESVDWPYDIVWFTSARPAQDHCAELRERFGKKP